MVHFVGEAAMTPASIISAAGWYELAVMRRKGDLFDVARDGEKDLIVALYGVAVWLGETTRRQATAECILSRIVEGTEVAAHLDGSFQLAVVDGTRREVRLISDHLASVPLFYSHLGRRLAFAPSGRGAGAILGRRPRLSLPGAIGYLTVGYPLGDRTMLESVSRVRPAHQVLYHASEGALRTSAYWDLRLGAGQRMSVRDAARELHTGVLEAHRSTLVDDPSEVHLALTGGWDSRLVLAALCEIGRPPARTFTWGGSSHVDGSDPDIATKVAAWAQVPHTVLSYDAADLIANLDAWCLESEMLSDNTGHFAAGSRFLAEHGLSPAVVLIGDQLFGPGGMFSRRDDAVAGALGIPWPELPPSTEAILKSGARGELLDAVGHQVEGILALCSSEHPKDLHHYLSFHTGLFGWLMAPGYYKEPVVAARRPLLTRTLLDLVTQWPREFRIDKKVEIAVLKKYHPGFHALPTQSSSALIDWRSTIGPSGILSGVITRLVAGESLRQSELRQVVDFDKCTSLIAGLSDGKRNRIRRWEWAFEIRRALARVPGQEWLVQAMSRVGRGATGAGQRTTPTRLLFRVALLERFSQLLEGS